MEKSEDPNFGISNNGRRLLEFCAANGLSVSIHGANTNNSQVMYAEYG